jgi:SulP family sulfate permease
LTRRASAAADLVAGLTVALVGLPQCLAYAMLAGVPPAHGLATAIVAGLVAALLGRSAQVVTGPTNTTGLLVLGALGPFLGADGVLRSDGLPALATLTLLTGLLRLAAAWSGGAGLIRFLPESVLVGFTAGAGILIAAMQIDEALGLAAVRGDGLAAELRALDLTQVRAPALVVTLGGVALLTAARRRFPRLPAALLVVAGAACLAWALDLDGRHGLALVGERASVPGGWPPGAWPSFDPALWRSLSIPASAIVLLGTLELAVTARAGGARPDLRREMQSQGWANLAGAFASAFPASASLTRSALLRVDGAHTRLAAGSAAVFTLPLLLAAAPLAGRIPLVALAAVLIVTADRMIDRHAMRRLWRASPETRLLLGVTLLATLLLPLEWAILLGSGTGLVIHLAKTSAPRLRLLAPEGARLAPVRSADAPEVVVLEVSGNLHYAAVPPFVSAAEDLIPSSARVVVLDLSHAHEIRFSALVALERLAEGLAHDGASLVLAGVDADTQELLLRAESGLCAVPAEDEPGLSVRCALEQHGTRNRETGPLARLNSLS